MRRISIIFSNILALTLASAKPIKEGDEIHSYESAFHHVLHDSAEFYLVCIYEVKKKPWRKEWGQLEIKATVIDPIKGDKKVGEKINYGRILDGKYGDISKMVGSLLFIRFTTNDGTPAKKPFVDRQDPLSTFRYSPEFHEIARKHTKIKDAFDQWKEAEYEKRFDEKISKGVIKPDAPKNLANKKLELQYYQAGFIRGILDLRSFEGHRNSTAYGNFYYASSGIFRKEAEGHSAGVRAAFKLGEQVKKALDEQLTHWIKTDSLPPEFRKKE